MEINDRIVRIRGSFVIDQDLELDQEVTVALVGTVIDAGSRVSDKPGHKDLVFVIKPQMGTVK